MKKELGFAIKISKQITNLNQSQEITTYAPSYIGYHYECNSKPSACTNKAFSSTSTRFNPYFGWCVLHIYFIPAIVGIKLCRCATECYICTCIWLLPFFVSGSRWLYLFAYFLLWSLLSFSNLDFLNILYIMHTYVQNYVTWWVFWCCRFIFKTWNQRNNIYCWYVNI